MPNSCRDGPSRSAWNSHVARISGVGRRLAVVRAEPVGPRAVHSLRTYERTARAQGYSASKQASPALPLKFLQASKPAFDFNTLVFGDGEFPDAAQPLASFAR